jgi:hypothetical protein
MAGKIKFLDQLMAPLRRRVPPMKVGGSGGTAVWGGVVQEREKESALIGTEKYRTFSDLLANVSIVGASVRYFLNLVAKPTWKMIPPEDGGSEAEEIAELIEEFLQDMNTPWHRVVRRAGMFKFHGYSIQEWTAKRRDDGKIGFLDVEARPQATIERWDVDENSNVVGVAQRSPQTSELLYIPRQKLAYLVDDSLSDSPEGLGLFPVARAPLAALQEEVDAGRMTQEDATAVVKPLRDFIEKHIKNPELGLLLDSKTYESSDERQAPSGTPQWAVDLMRGDGTGGTTESISSSIERITRELARIMGTEFLLLGGDGKGSLALSRDKTQGFALLVDSALVEVAQAYKQDLIGPLFMLNGWDDKLKPTPKTEQIQYRDIEQITGALVDLAQAGATLAPDDEAINEVRDLLGLSHAEMRSMLEDAELQRKATVTSFEEGGKNGSNQNGKPAASKPALPAKKGSS